jgi:hypothetical protein
MIKANHVMGPHFVDDLLSVLAARVVYVYGQLDWLFSPVQILRMFVQIREHNDFDEVCFA